MTRKIVPFVHALSEVDATLWIAALSSALPEAEICTLDSLTDIERSEIEVAIVANPNPADLAALPNLKWVQSLWAGVERLLQDMPEPTVQVVRLTDFQLVETMAEAVLAWTLYLHRDMPRYARQQRLATWQQHELPTAANRRVSVLGLGQLGQAAAERLVENGFDVRGWSRSPKDINAVQTASGVEGMTPLLSETDILVVLLPSTPSTRGLLDGAALDCLPKGAQIINFARADIIETPALVERLASNRIKHVVLDVFAQEPLAPNDPLWANPAVTVLPHISAPTSRKTASTIVARSLRDWFANGTMPTPVSRFFGY